MDASWLRESWGMFEENLLSGMVPLILLHIKGFLKEGILCKQTKINGVLTTLNNYTWEQ